jgi:hypothetical protein
MENKVDTQLLDEISQQFLRVVNLTFGAETANQAISALEGTLGKSWKDRVILNKLSNLYQVTGRISFRLVDDDLYRSGGSGIGFKIRAIKVLRSMTNLGLVESKAAIEKAETSVQTAELERSTGDDPLNREKSILNSIEELRQCGFEVNFA